MVKQFLFAASLAAALPAFAVQALLMAPWVSCDTEENL